MPERVTSLTATIICIVLALAACSSGGGGSSKARGPARAPACPLVARLDDIANGVALIDVSDPVASKRALGAAVSQYATTVQTLRGVAPSSLSASLSRVAADVQQYRFADALTDRAPLDAYAQHTCGRTVTAVVVPSTTAPNITATTTPGSTATTTASAVTSTTAG